MPHEYLPLNELWMDARIDGWMRGWMDEHKLVSILNLRLHQEVGGHALSPDSLRGRPKAFLPQPPECVILSYMQHPSPGESPSWVVQATCEPSATEQVRESVQSCASGGRQEPVNRKLSPEDGPEGRRIQGDLRVGRK